MEQLEAKSVLSHVSVGWGIQHWMNLADSAQGRGWSHRVSCLGPQVLAGAAVSGGLVLPAGQLMGS